MKANNDLQTPVFGGIHQPTSAGSKPASSLRSETFLILSYSPTPTPGFCSWGNPRKQAISGIWEVYWVDSQGQAMMSEEKSKNMVVGKVRMILDTGIAHFNEHAHIEIHRKGIE